MSRIQLFHRCSLRAQRALCKNKSQLMLDKVVHEVSVLSAVYYLISLSGRITYHFFCVDWKGLQISEALAACGCCLPMHLCLDRANQQCLIDTTSKAAARP